MALAVLIVCCLTANIYAQTAVADTATTIAFEIITTTEATVGEGPAVDTIFQLVSGINVVQILLAAILMLLVQPEFTLIKADFVRTRNIVNILMKSFVDLIPNLSFCRFIGSGIVFGPGNSFEIPHFMSLLFDSSSLPDPTSPPTEGFLMFQTMFYATLATIIPGVMAKRTRFSMYLVYTISISVLVYPISGCWIWRSGWLMNSEIGSLMTKTFGATFRDFADSTIVHSADGQIALVGAAILGPYIGKYGKGGQSKAIPGHSLIVAALGVFILWFGWFGFNSGSQLVAATTADQVAILLVSFSTNLTACTGGFFALGVSRLRYGRPSLSLTPSDILAGLVGITAGHDTVSLQGAVVIEAICGTPVIYSMGFVGRVLKVDDPVGTSSVYDICGLTGTILTGLFSISEGLFYDAGTNFLEAQILGMVLIRLWVIGMGFIIFKTLDKIHGLYVLSRIEEEGLNIYEHGESVCN